MKLVMKGLLCKGLDYYRCQACGYGRHVKTGDQATAMVKPNPQPKEKGKPQGKLF